MSLRRLIEWKLPGVNPATHCAILCFLGVPVVFTAVGLLARHLASPLGNQAADGITVVVQLTLVALASANVVHWFRHRRAALGTLTPPLDRQKTLSAAAGVAKILAAVSAAVDRSVGPPRR